MPDFTVEIVPRKQFRAYFERHQKRACMVVHRRAGKTYCCLQDLVLRALNNERLNPPPRYAYIAPTRDQAKDIAWSYLKRFAAKIPGCTRNQADLSVVFPNAATLRLYSGDSYERMRGLYFDGVVIDEPADIDPSAWPLVILPCLADYSGWATFIGTPKGHNGFWDIWRKSTSDPGWFSMLLKASESGILSPKKLLEMRGETTENGYRQEFECDFTVPILGAVYAKLIDEARAQGRICPMPIDGSNFVNTSWDLGSPENTVVWYWQIVGREIRMIDCDRGDKGTLMERVAMMIRKSYNLGKHYLPHDAQQTERTGTTMATELAKLLPGVVTVPRVHDVWIGINHALELFPALSFRSPHCDDGLTALSAYRTRREGEGARTVDEPVHDWSSHTADAFRTMAEAHRAGMVSFKHTTAEPRPGWYVPGVSPFRVHVPGSTGGHRVRRGAKPMRLM